MALKGPGYSYPKVGRLGHKNELVVLAASPSISVIASENNLAGDTSAGGTKSRTPFVMLELEVVCDEGPIENIIRS